MKTIRQVFHLDFQWQTLDPFLFCVHHDDAYPKGNEQMGPDASLAGRNIGQDFAGVDGWRMYHGTVVPGFPRHPHRGFETITVARRGYIDHSDSLGATARYGHGDVQWMTAGEGIVHSEMFPLVEREQNNPCELFQIWLNLPPDNKMVQPRFKMLWADTVPDIVVRRPGGQQVNARLVAGRLGDIQAPAPAPDSWAADPANEVTILPMKFSPGATWEIPPASPGINRVLYVFRGGDFRIADHPVTPKVGVHVEATHELELVNGDTEAELLMLQGRPIAKPVAHYGPFVMNTRAELEQAFADYRRTQFGGWPWKSDDPVHERQSGRFARHPDGSIDKPSTA